MVSRTLGYTSLLVRCMIVGVSLFPCFVAAVSSILAGRACTGSTLVAVKYGHWVVVPIMSESWILAMMVLVEWILTIAGSRGWASWVIKWWAECTTCLLLEKTGSLTVDSMQKTIWFLGTMYSSLPAAIEKPVIATAKSIVLTAE